MEIKEVIISNFKGISDLTFSPKKINIIVGKNNTGKTSILEAIYYTMEASPLEIQARYESHLSSLININAKEAKVLLKMEGENKYLLLSRPEIKEIIPEFKKDLIEKLKTFVERMGNKDALNKATEILDKLLTDDKLLFEIQKEALTMEFGGKKTVLFSYSPAMLRQIGPIIDRFEEDLYNERKHRGMIGYILTHPRVFMSLPREHNIKTANLINNLILEDITLLELSKNKSKINEIQKYLQGKKILEHLERFDVDMLLFKEHNKEYQIPYAFMGDGLKALIGLIAQTTPENKLVLVEEPENRMHPGYIKELVRHILDFSEANNTQFFITTHSSDILKTAVEDVLEPRYQEYLSKELSIIHMNTLDSQTFVQEIDRKKAKNDLEELLLDLRGS